MNLAAHVAANLRAQKLFGAGDRILVAVSGGVDSMVLLAVLCELAERARWKLCVAHFNHHLRGRASASDERLVSQTADALGFRCVVAGADVKAAAQARGISVEMAARELRHQFLARTARRLKCAVVATAHHADDQVELFFLRLLRGAGSEGLGGMKWSSPSPADGWVRLARPLLDVTKAELRAYAAAHGIRYREDASNDSGEMLRNRVRHELLPLLRRKFQPALHRTVLRLMDLAGADAEAVGRVADEWLAAGSRRDDWDALAIAVQRRVIQRQLLHLEWNPDFELVEFLRRQPGKPICVQPGLTVIRDDAGRVTRVNPKAALAFNSTQLKLNLKADDHVSFGNLKLAWRFRVAKQTQGRKLANCEYFDAAKVGTTVILRHWQPGDRFQPIGMKAAVKLQDWFTNQKVPAARRRELVVATTEAGEVFWVEGLRIAELAKLTPSTRRVLQWRWRLG